MYPNPASEKLTVILPEETSVHHFSLVSMMGEEVLNSRSDIIDISRVPDGVYILKVTYGKFEKYFKIIIDH